MDLGVGVEKGNRADLQPQQLNEMPCVISLLGDEFQRCRLGGPDQWLATGGQGNLAGNVLQCPSSEGMIVVAVFAEHVEIAHARGQTRPLPQLRDRPPTRQYKHRTA